MPVAPAPLVLHVVLELLLGDFDMIVNALAEHFNRTGEVLYSDFSQIKNPLSALAANRGRVILLLVRIR